MGNVAGKGERLVPRLPNKSLIGDASALLSIYPRGSKLEVLYNPHETESIIQGETLRVVHRTPGFWSEEERLRKKLAMLVFLPVPLTLGVYAVLRYFHQCSEE